MTYLIQVILSGLFIGSVYALLTVGFSMTWGIIGVLNIPKAIFGVLGAYIAYWFYHQTGIAPMLSLIIIVPVFFLIGMGFYKLLIKRLVGIKGIYEGGSMVLTFGLTMMIENAMAWTWGPDPRVITSAYSSSSFVIGSVLVPISGIIGFTISIFGILLIQLFMHNTYIGKAVQATWQDPTAAVLSGINTDHVSMITFGIAISSAGIAGVALALSYAFYPAIQISWLVFVFLIAILGGVGNIVGVLVGGLIVGLLTSVGGSFIPYAWVNLLVFGLLLLILLIKPTGLFKV